MLGRECFLKTSNERKKNTQPKKENTINLWEKVTVVQQAEIDTRCATVVIFSILQLFNLIHIKTFNLKVRNLLINKSIRIVNLMS